MFCGCHEYLDTHPYRLVLSSRIKITGAIDADVIEEEETKSGRLDEQCPQEGDKRANTNKHAKYPSKPGKGSLRRLDKTRKLSSKLNSKLNEVLGRQSEVEKESDNSTKKEKAPKLLMVRTVNHLHEPFDEKTQDIKVLLLCRFLVSPFSRLSLVSFDHML